MDMTLMTKTDPDPKKKRRKKHRILNTDNNIENLKPPAEIRNVSITHTLLAHLKLVGSFVKKRQCFT
jgi:hypothetical protein